MTRTSVGRGGNGASTGHWHSQFYWVSHGRAYIKVTLCFEVMFKKLT